jgi:radical SAM protein with 4Fe4S-binding SPASM domain
VETGIKVRLKAMALRSNVHEFSAIASFCRQWTGSDFRFDPFVNLRFDRSSIRNEEIRSERLSPEEIVGLELADPERSEALLKDCAKVVMPGAELEDSNRLFYCGAGRDSFVVSHDGLLRLCPVLCHPDCLYDLRKGSLADGWQNFVPRVLDFTSDGREFLDGCRVCHLFDLCMWCPAHTYLETGHLDKPVDYFCDTAQARANSVKDA